MGNFEYDVRESPDGYMFIFNDNEEDSGTAQPGRGNAAIRTFNAVEGPFPLLQSTVTTRYSRRPGHAGPSYPLQGTPPAGSVPSEGNSLHRTSHHQYSAQLMIIDAFDFSE